MNDQSPNTMSRRQLIRHTAWFGAAVGFAVVGGEVISHVAGATEHAAAGRPIVAECGGMVYLCESVTDVDGVTTPMLGLLPGQATMQRRFAALGMQQLDTRTGPMRGHTFHYSRLATPLAPVATAARPDGEAGSGEAVYRAGAIVATYMHMYWPSNPDAAAALFGGDAF